MRPPASTVRCLPLALFFVAASAALLAVSWHEPAWSDPGAAQLKSIDGFGALAEGWAADPTTVHPGYVLLGSLLYHVWPSLTAIAALSAVPTALAGAVVLWYALANGYSLRAGALVAAAFLTTHAVFWNGSAPEVYGVQIALLGLETWLLFAYWRRPHPMLLGAFGLLSGFSLSVCQLEVFTGFAAVVTWILFKRSRPSPAAFLLAAAGFVVGFLPALVFMLPSVHGPASLVQEVRHFLVGKWAGTMMRGVADRESLITKALVAFSFIGLAQWQAVRRLPRIIASAEDCFLATLALSSGVFVLTYNIKDAFTFAGPTIFALYMFALRGRFQVSARTAVPLLLQPLLVLIGLAALHLGMPEPRRDRAIPYRDDAQYFLNPVRLGLQRGPMRLVHDLQDVANDPGTAVVVHYVAYEPLAVAQRLGRARGLHLIEASERFVGMEEAREACARPAVERLVLLHPTAEIAALASSRAPYFIVACADLPEGLQSSGTRPVVGARVAAGSRNGIPE